MRNLRLKAGPALLAGSFLLAGLFWPVAVLEVRSLPSRALLFRTKLPASGRFELRYTHSWDKTPVWEVFASDARGDLILVEESYLWMGAGLDFQPAADFDFSGERVRVRRNRHVGELRLAVGTVADHRLVVGSREVSLVRFAPPGSKVLLKVRRLPRFLSLLGPNP
ncbi:MAG: hypothetical protein PWQ41_513 [Bacillota bacterium]|jgi:hypothetical protein|nr:hypothetical protein [Bacillota bacterium]MDK2924739.1 hypothetical protein [Bacillota bacterium]MDK2960597.1 hypothetical protein [Bacillota bacterium]